MKKLYSLPVFGPPATRFSLRPPSATRGPLNGLGSAGLVPVCTARSRHKVAGGKKRRLSGTSGTEHVPPLTVTFVAEPPRRALLPFTEQATSPFPAPAAGP